MCQDDDVDISATMRIMNIVKILTSKMCDGNSVELFDINH